MTFSKEQLRKEIVKLVETRQKEGVFWASLQKESPFYQHLIEVYNGGILNKTVDSPEYNQTIDLWTDLAYPKYTKLGRSLYGV